jgi:hypothetical protein
MRPKLPPIEQADGTPFEKFDRLFRAVISVPKAEIERRESEWRKAKKKRPTKRPRS